MAKRGRPKKSTEQHKLDGTYQACRHKDNTDVIIADILTVPEKIEVPEQIKNLKNKKIEKAFKEHVDMLITLKVFYIPDLPELVNLYLILADIEKTRSAISEIDLLKNENTFDMFYKLNSLFLKQVAAFNTLGSKFFLTPQARTQMTLGNLQAINENLKLQEKMQKAETSPIQKLVNNKKS